MDSLEIHPEFIAPVIVLFSWNMPSSVEKGSMTMAYDPTYQESTSVAFPELAMKGMAPPEEVEQGTDSDGLAAAGVQLDGRIALSERGVSGLYRGTRGDFQLELRVDVDGSRPMNRLSGDLFRVTGATTNYFGSFIVNSPTVTRTASSVTIEGLGEYTWSTEAPRVKVTMSPAAPVTIQFFTISGSPGSIYICPFVSSYFRSVQWEQDSVVGTVPFVSYNTGSLPQPPNSPSRELTVSKAYAEAGIGLQTAGLTNIVDTSASGTDTKWTDSELHAAMVSKLQPLEGRSSVEGVPNRCHLPRRRLAGHNVRSTGVPASGLRRVLRCHPRY